MKPQPTEPVTATKKLTPPYMPYRTLSGVLAGWQVHLHARIDRSVLRTYAGGMQGLIIATLRYFRLIDEEGLPSTRLEELVKSEGSARQFTLRRMLTEGYPFLFNSKDDVTKMTPSMIRERFEAAGASGDTLNKCISFFTAMAKDAGISLTPLLRTRQRRGSNGKRMPKENQTKPLAALVDTNVLNAMKTIKLPLAKGHMTLSGNFNLFDLAGDERDLVFTIIDKMKAFEAAHAPKEGKP